MNNALKNKLAIKSLCLIGLVIIFTMCSKDEDIVVPYSPYNGNTTAIFNTAIAYDSVTDQDGNVYKTITIGTQTWMAENLRTTTYTDGTAIPNVTDDDEWGVLTTGAYCNYNNTTSVDTIATYGRLYNWYAVNTGKLAPSGWHVPTIEEWATLTDYLGDEDIAGGKLKKTGTSHWISPNKGTTNETGFTALPGGIRNYNDTFNSIGYFGYWWSTTEFNVTYAWLHYLRYNGSYVSGYGYSKAFGFSVRCIKD